MSKKRIVLLEPFYGGSHQQWADQLAKYSKHEFTFLTLPDRHWKWRMHGAAVSLAAQFDQLDFEPDLIVATDMLDLSVFKALTSKKTHNLPFVLYMHENQILYPWSPEDEDVKLNRDRHYGFINYTSCLAADYVCFNSQYHHDAFLGALPSFLGDFPDHTNKGTVDSIVQKSSVLPLGAQLPSNENKRGGIPRLLWNHRWEYDKGIEEFEGMLSMLKAADVSFELAVVGESFGKHPKAFDRIREQFQNEIVSWGFLESRSQYYDLLNTCHFLPVTSRQDFFGLSIAEAIAAGCIPVLPDRLSYPSLIPESYHEQLLYSEKEAVFSALTRLIQNPIDAVSELDDHIRQFDWVNIISRYDEFFVAVSK